MVFGVEGLALAVTLTYLLYFLILGILLKPGLNSELLKDFYISLLKILFVSLISGLVASLLFSFLGQYLSMEKVVNLVINAGIAFVVSLICFFSLSYKLKIKEITEVRNILVQKVLNRNKG